MITFEDGVSIAHFHATHGAPPRSRSMAELALAEYQRILSECVENGGRPDVVIAAMDCIMGRRTERAASRSAGVDRQRVRTAMRSIRLELTQAADAAEHDINHLDMQVCD